MGENGQRETEQHPGLLRVPRQSRKERLGGSQCSRRRDIVMERAAALQAAVRAGGGEGRHAGSACLAVGGTGCAFMHTGFLICERG